MTPNPSRTRDERHPWYSSSTSAPTSNSTSTTERKRTRPMEVLNPGMMWTGTMSMQQALDILHIPCYHGAVLLGKPADIPLWTAALDAKFYDKGTSYTRPDRHALLGDFGAVSDVPAIAFAEDLVEAYPEAKVVLVDREREAWRQSFEEGVVRACWSPVTHFVARLDRRWLGPMTSMTMRWVRGWLGSNSRQEMSEKAVENYERHYALVRKVTPPERLLEYRLGDGWEPLCEFLGRPVPDVPFSRANDRKSLKEMTELIVRKSVNGMVGRLRGWTGVGSVVVLGVAWVLYTKYLKRG